VVVQQQLANTDYRTLPFGVKVHIKSGSPDQCILDAVKEVNADLVVLGTSSKTGVSGLLPGSTVERLLPELSCSVMAIKPEGFRSMLPADFWTH
jgi:universal stress protein E